MHLTDYSLTPGLKITLLHFSRYSVHETQRDLTRVRRQSPLENLKAVMNKVPYLVVIFASFI